MWKTTIENSIASIEAVKNGSPIQRAAVEHGVPRPTLQDRVGGHVIHGSKPGPQPYLSHSEEGNLSEFLQAASQVGFPKTKRGQRYCRICCQRKGYPETVQNF